MTLSAEDVERMISWKGQGVIMIIYKKTKVMEKDAILMSASF